MDIKKRLALLIFCLALQGSAHAASILTLTLINNSSCEFVFDRVEVDYSGNTLSIDSKRLLPGGTAIITGTTTPGFDLAGNIFFKGDARMRIVDHRRFHFGQPVFAMKAKGVFSRISSKTTNPDPGPKVLLYSAATVILEDDPQ